jgi:hypothetical protein
VTGPWAAAPAINMCACSPINDSQMAVLETQWYLGLSEVQVPLLSFGVTDIQVPTCPPILSR